MFCQTLFFKKIKKGQKKKKKKKYCEKIIYLLKLQPTTAKNHFLFAFMSKN